MAYIVGTVLFLIAAIKILRSPMGEMLWPFLVAGMAITLLIAVYCGIEAVHENPYLITLFGLPATAIAGSLLTGATVITYLVTPVTMAFPWLLLVATVLYLYAGWFGYADYEKMEFERLPEEEQGNALCKSGLISYNAYWEKYIGGRQRPNPE